MQHLRKPLLWAAAMLVAFLFIVWAGMLAWINSSHSRQWVQSKINAAIPGSLSIGTHNLSLIGLRLNLFEISVHDAQGLALAGVEHLLVDCDWRALWRGEIRLERVRIGAPWANMSADDTGTINLVSAFVPPTPSKNAPAGRTGGTAWPAGVVLERCQIDGGRFSWRFSGETGQLEIDSVSLLAGGDLMKRSGQLELTLADIRFTGAAIRPQPANLLLKAALADRVLEISELTLTSGRTRLDMTGSIADLDTRPTVDSLVTVAGPLSELQTALGLRTQLEGRATARLACKGALADPTADLALTVEKSSIAGVPMERGSADLHLRDRQVEIDTAVQIPGGGRIQLRGDADLRGAFPDRFLHAPFDPEELAYRLALRSEVPDLAAWLHRWTAIQGALSGRVNLAGKGVAPESLSARLEIDGAGSKLIAPGMQQPVAADLQVTARLDRGRLAVTRFNAGSEAVRLSGDGHFEWKGGNLEGRIAAEAGDLSSLLAIAGLPAVSGACRASGVVSGNPASLKADLSIDASAIGTDAVTVGDIDMRMVWEKGVLTVDRLHVKNQESFLSAAGEVRLTAPDALRLLPDPTVAFTVVSDHFDPGDFVAGASGQFGIDARLTGSLDKPSGRLILAGRDAKLAGQAFESIVLDAHLEEDRLWLDRLVGSVAARQEIRVSGWLARDRSFDLALTANDVTASRIEGLQGLIPGDGVLHLAAAAKGNLDEPEVDGRLTVSDVVINAEPFDDFSLDFSLRQGVARVTGRLAFDVDAFCDFNKGDFEGRLAFSRTETAAYFKAAGQPDIRGTLTGKVTAKGNFHDAATITAEAALRHLDLYYEDIPLVRSDRLDARFENRTLFLPGSRLTLLSTGNLTLKGEARIDGRLDIGVAGRVPLRVAGLFIQDLDDATGDLVLQATFSGPSDNPQMRAQIEMEAVGLSIPGTKQRLHDLNGRIHLTPERLRVAGLNGSLDTGSFAVEGTVELDRFTPRRLDLAIELTTLPLEIPDTLEVLLNGDIRLTGSQEAARASGQIVLLEGLNYKDAKINLVQMATTRQRPVAPPSDAVTVPYFDRVDLDIALSHRQPLAVENNLAELEIRPDLKIGGTLNRPVVSGRAQVTAGTITFQKKTFDVRKGVIDFVNPYRTEPEIDIESRTQIRSWEIFLAVKGTPDNLDVSLTSQPEETQSNLLSLILFGRTARELTAGEGVVQRTTSQIMAEMLADTFGDDIKSATGLDILQLETNGSSDSQDAGDDKVTVGKHLSDRMTVKYAVETKDGETIQRAITEYKLLEHILLSGFQENTGNYGSELVFRIEFR